MKKTKPAKKCKPQEVATCSGQAVELISVPAVVRILDELIKEAEERLDRATDDIYREGIQYHYDHKGGCSKLLEVVEQVRGKSADLDALIRLKDKLKFITLE